MCPKYLSSNCPVQNRGLYCLLIPVSVSLCPSDPRPRSRWRAPLAPFASSEKRICNEILLVLKMDFQIENAPTSQGWGSSHWERNAVPVPSTHGQTYLLTDSTGAEAQKERRSFFPAQLLFKGSLLLKPTKTKTELLTAKRVQ